MPSELGATAAVDNFVEPDAETSCPSGQSECAATGRALGCAFPVGVGVTVGNFVAQGSSAPGPSGPMGVDTTVAGIVGIRLFCGGVCSSSLDAAAEVPTESVAVATPVSTSMLSRSLVLELVATTGTGEPSRETDADHVVMFLVLRSMASWCC